MDSSERVFLISIALVGVGLLAYGVGNWSGRSEPTPAASRVHIPSGQLDTDYAFAPGGTAGDIAVYGLPSGRLLRRIPVFEPEGAAGYATADGPARRRLSDTGGTRGDLRGLVRHEGSLYVSDRLFGRLARVSLASFEVEALDRVHDLQAPGDVAIAGAEKRRYVAVVGQSGASRNGLVAFLDPTTLGSAFHVSLPGPARRMAADPRGRWVLVTVAWSAPDKAYARLRKTDALYCIDLEACEEARKLPENWLGVAGKKAGGRFTVERVHGGSLAASAGLAKGDVIVNLSDVAGKKAGDQVHLDVRRGKESKQIDVTLDTPVLGAAGVSRDIPIPLGSSAVSVSPDGTYALVGADESGTVSVVGLDRIAKSARPTDALVCEVPVGNGPSDSVVDERGNVYTALRTESQVVKWRLDRATAGRSDFQLARTRVPYGPTGLALGTTTVLAFCSTAGDQYLPTGPITQANMVLLGRGLELLTQTPVAHAASGAVVINGQKLTFKTKKPESSKVTAAGVQRSGNAVTVTLHVSRDRIEPAEFEVIAGDKVTLVIHDIEPIPGVGHGIAVTDHAAGAPVPSGGKATLTFTAGAPGTYWYYDTRGGSTARGLMAIKSKK